MMNIVTLNHEILEAMTQEQDGHYYDHSSNILKSSSGCQKRNKSENVEGKRHEFIHIVTAKIV